MKNKKKMYIPREMEIQDDTYFFLEIWEIMKKKCIQKYERKRPYSLWNYGYIVENMFITEEWW